MYTKERWLLELNKYRNIQMALDNLIVQLGDENADIQREVLGWKRYFYSMSDKIVGKELSKIFDGIGNSRGDIK